MKLKTLIEVQQCFDLLREAERKQEPLSPADYVRCLSAKAIFGFELGLILNKMPAVEVTNDERYKFLRDEFALKADDDEAEFKKLAHVSGAEFDKVIDNAMGAA